MNSNFDVDESQQLLADSAARYLERGYGHEAYRASAAHANGCDPARWAEFAELGWLALPIAEVHGGLGGTLADVCVLAEQLGRGLVVEPFVAGGVLPDLLLAELPAGALRDKWLDAVSQGDQRLAFAPWEPRARHSTSAVATCAEEVAGRWVLHGAKSLAPGAAGADAFVLCARTGASTLGLFLVESDAHGLTADARALYDGRHAAALRFEGVSGALLANAGDAQMVQLIDHVMDRVAIVHCAETIGTMAQALDITREYLVTRHQFGKSIASNQVIQHRLVDLFVEIEEGRSLVRAAAVEPTPRMAAAVSACIAHAARHVWEEVLQLHGAIGMTEEYVIGRYVRRLALAGSLYGDVHHHLERLATQSLGEIA